MPILKQVSSSSMFVSFFIVITHDSSVNFKVIHFLLCTKGSNQSPNFDTFECSGENYPNSSFQPTSQLFFKFYITLSAIKDDFFLYFIISSNIYFAQKEPIEVRLSSSQVKVCQIPHVSFRTTS